MVYICIMAVTALLLTCSLHHY